MVILITGASHVGKTMLSQRLLEELKFPYFSLDHLKMGLIRSKNTQITVFDDEKLTPYLWNITKEIIKTAIENKQNLIIEGCYIPPDFTKDFSEEYLKEIRFIALVMSRNYIENNINDIKKFASVVEKHIDGNALGKEYFAEENEKVIRNLNKYKLEYYLIDENYNTDEIINYIKTKL